MRFASMRSATSSPLLAFIALLLCSCRPDASRPAAPAAPPAPLLAPAEDLAARYAKSDIQITLDEFNQLRPGMTHEQVVEIVGAEESASKSRYNAGDEETFTRPSMTFIYRWENPDGSWCELEFIDKKLEAKRHQDLKLAAAYAGSTFTLPETRKALPAPPPAR